MFIENQSEGGGAIHTLNVSSLNIVGNTFYDNSGGESDDILDGTFAPDNRIINNNIFADSASIDSTKIDLDVRLDNETNDISNNIVARLAELRGEAISEFGEGNIVEDADPLFVDAPAGDLRLQPDSPAIDAGNDEVVNDDATDVVGNLRINGEAVDIGAYEYDLYLAIDDVRLVEGDRGRANAEFTVSLSNTEDLSPTQNVFVEYTTAPRSATSGADFIGTSGRLTFNANNDTRRITVPIVGDTDAELSEFFDVSLSNPTGAGGGIIADGTGVGLIQNDDRLPEGTSDRFSTAELDASFYIPTATENTEVVDLLPNLQLESPGGFGFITEPAFSEA